MKTSILKRQYVAPSMEAYQMQMETRLLTGSEQVMGATLGGLSDGGSLNDEW